MSQDPAARDALALIACHFRGDEAGADVILRAYKLRQLREVTKFLAYLAAGAMRRISGDAPDELLLQMTGEHLLRLASDDQDEEPEG